MADAGADIRSAIDGWLIEQRFSPWTQKDEHGHVTVVDGDIHTNELADHVLIDLYERGWRVIRG